VIRKIVNVSAFSITFLPLIYPLRTLPDATPDTISTYTYGPPDDAQEINTNKNLGGGSTRMANVNPSEYRLMTYLIIKSLHMITGVVTISGFILRGYWMMAQSDKLQLKVIRIAPHIVDTLFLLSGIALVSMLQLNVFSESWLLAKFAGLIGYIVLGTFALKRGATPQIRSIAFVGAVAIFAYIVGVALAKSPASWLALLAG
jgi:uncharacterized membrane protein SirB2